MNISKLLKGVGGVTTAIALSISAASAMPTQGPTNNNFYSPPAVFNGEHGELIWYRQATVDLGNNAPSVNAWNVLYHSTDALGAPNKVTGTVIIPTSRWTGGTARPIISYAVGTHGLAQSCAPSIQMARGTDYENANYVAALNDGYAVLITDNPGYTTGDTPTYMVGKAQAHAALDIVDAAMQIPGANISPQAKTAIWGYSQGGQTAAWASEVHSSYSPTINLVAVAAGGTPADFLDTAHLLDGSAGASFMLGAIIGLSEQYPNEWPIDDVINSAGANAIDSSKSECVFESLFNYMNNDISMYTIGRKGLDRMLRELPAAKQSLQAQDLGVNKISIPMYQYHGQADEFIPIEQHYALKKQYCKSYDNVTFDLFPSEHIVTQFQAAPYVLSWLDDRFSGKPAQGTCDTRERAPRSTANRGGGDFVVTLDEWPLAVTMQLKTLGQQVKLPDASTFTADTNMTRKTLKGAMVVPEFLTDLNIILPLDVKLAIIPTSPISGAASLDDNGILHIAGNAYADVKVVSAGFGWFQIPFGCKTDDPVDFPLSFDGPISDLGAGNLNFSGITEFAKMRSCGLFNGLFTVLMSGAGQQYEFNVSPPAPTAN